MSHTPIKTTSIDAIRDVMLRSPSEEMVGGNWSAVGADDGCVLGCVLGCLDGCIEGCPDGFTES